MIEPGDTGPALPNEPLDGGRALKTVDVFSDTAGLGNPVAVVLDSEGLSDDEMARFAAWTNLSETTFVCEPTQSGADYRVRIFTPSVELPFAGHPTIGTCHAWLEARGQLGLCQQIVQECSAVLITVRSHSAGLAFATPQLVRSGDVSTGEFEGICDTLGLSCDRVVASSWIDNGPGWLGVLVDSVETLYELKPTLEPGSAVGVAALGPGAPGGSLDQPALHLRAFFTTDTFTREDPVTGSLNGSMAQWMLTSGFLKAPYLAVQGHALGRRGKVAISQSDGEIWVGGQAVTVVSGSVAI